jgi:hypothetical protein
MRDIRSDREAAEECQKRSEKKLLIYVSNVYLFDDVNSNWVKLIWLSNVHLKFLILRRLRILKPKPWKSLKPKKNLKFKIFFGFRKKWSENP